MQSPPAARPLLTKALRTAPGSKDGNDLMDEANKTTTKKGPKENFQWDYKNSPWYLPNARPDLKCQQKITDITEMPPVRKWKIGIFQSSGNSVSRNIFVFKIPKLWKRILQPARIIPAILHRGKPSHFSFFEYFLLWRGCPYVQNFPLFSWKSLSQDLEFASLQLSSFRLTHMTPLFATVTLPLCLSQLGILLPWPHLHFSLGSPQSLLRWNTNLWF